MEAQEFEGIISSENSVTWDRPDECSVFIQKLLQAGQKLSSRNRRLRNLHAHIQTRLASLENVDLFKYCGKWDEIVREISDVFEKEAKYVLVGLFFVLWDCVCERKCVQIEYCKKFIDMGELLGYSVV